MTPIISPPAAPKPAAAGESQQSATAPTPLVRRGRPPKDGIPKTPAGAQAGKVLRDTELKKLEEHQRLVGATMGRMGCILANEERRDTFLDDEDFEDVGWSSEFDPGHE